MVSRWPVDGLPEGLIPFVSHMCTARGADVSDGPSGARARTAFPEVDSPYPLVNDVPTLWLK